MTDETTVTQETVVQPLAVTPVNLPPKFKMTPEENHKRQGKRAFKKKVNCMSIAEVEKELNRMRGADHEQSVYYGHLMTQLKEERQRSFYRSR